mmetsp:Transcript_19885/g.48816  ORF Transcript_19885/g.48816 Transcript_19885/m.48816 type:complete len:94 (+) Transcript_19885:1085-1366(+)
MPVSGSPPPTSLPTDVQESSPPPTETTDESSPTRAPTQMPVSGSIPTEIPTQAGGDDTPTPPSPKPPTNVVDSATQNPGVGMLLCITILLALL